MGSGSIDLTSSRSNELPLAGPSGIGWTLSGGESLQQPNEFALHPGQLVNLIIKFGQAVPDKCLGVSARAKPAVANFKQLPNFTKTKSHVLSPSDEPDPLDYFFGVYSVP
jgi:hypothetical protein